MKGTPLNTLPKESVDAIVRSTERIEGAASILAMLEDKADGGRVTPSEIAAVRCLLDSCAAELGEAMADYNMGWHLEQAGKLSEAYAHYRKAADGNDDSAWWALGRFYGKGVVVAQDGKEARRCYETGEKLGSVKCKMRLARCKLLGIGGHRAKKAGLDLCRQALELAKESSEKEDYGYGAEMNLLRRTIAENES